MNNHPRPGRWLLAALLCGLGHPLAADDPAASFRNPPDSARPGVYWYFMDGNLSKVGMTRDLEAMQAAGIGNLVFLEVNVGVPRGPVPFLSEEWQNLYVHAVREAERLGIEITLGSGPGWTGSGGPWVTPAQSMQHLVASATPVQGPGRFKGTLPVPPPRHPFFGAVPPQMKAQWDSYFNEVAVLAYPASIAAARIADADEKALYYRAPFSSQPNVKPRLDAPAEFPTLSAGAVIPLNQILDLTSKLRPGGILDWQVPPGKWTVLRFVSRNNGASTRPAPAPGIGFECDKFDTAALDAHFDQYVGKLLRKVGPRPPGRGWTMLHIDSWEMGAQNWSPKLRQEFLKRRGYDPQPFYPAYLGGVVGSLEQSERFLWDLRLTGQELVIENHARHLKELGRRHGLNLSIEPYDMNPSNDFDLGAVADVPMCEFWSIGFNSTYSCHTASSIGHVLGRPVVAAEAFTGSGDEAWRFYPGSLKNQGDWAFATGINRFVYHTFAHKPDEGRPGMVMGPYGVHWDRGQTWWPMVGAYHRYITRCQHLLRQGRSIADLLYLMPEGAPNVFQPPPSALVGDPRLPDRRGYNFDGCSAQALIELASVRDGCVVFPSGASYRLLVLPDVATMTPRLLDKLAALAKAGATLVGNPPRKSPSLTDFPECDRTVAGHAAALWGSLTPPLSLTKRPSGNGHLMWGAPLSPGSSKHGLSAILQARWIWHSAGDPAKSAPMGTVHFQRELVVAADRKVVAASLEMTADNAFSAVLNGTVVGQGDNFHQIIHCDLSTAIQPGLNRLEIRAENTGEGPNPAGLLGALRIEFADGSVQLSVTGDQWTSSLEPASARQPVKVLGEAKMAPWHLDPTAPATALYPNYELTAHLLREMGVAEDFSSPGPLRHTHRSTAEGEVYFVANRTAEPVDTTATFRVANGRPERWDPLDGSIRTLPDATSRGGLTQVPLHFEAFGSAFVVFPKHPANGPGAPPQNVTQPTPIGQLDGPWELAFDRTLGGPAQIRFDRLDDWSQRPEPGIKFYSGMATYQRTFDLPPSPAASPSAPLYLDLGEVQVIARVRVNGIDCGTVWTAPWQVDISNAVKATGNLLEIDVANLWPNRMIGDATSPDKPFTQTTYRPYKAGQALLKSGLIGPVRLLRDPSPAAR